MEGFIELLPSTKHLKHFSNTALAEPTQKSYYTQIDHLLLRAGQARTHRLLRNQRLSVWLKALVVLSRACNTRRIKGTDSGFLLILLRALAEHPSRCFRSHPEISGSNPLPVTVSETPINGRFWFKSSLVPIKG